MKTPRRENISPVQRARLELGDAITAAMQLDALNDRQARALMNHLVIPNDFPEYRKKSIMRQKQLWGIGEAIISREDQLQHRRFVGAQLAQTGLLALAVGNSARKEYGLEHPSLLQTTLVEQLSSRNPRVDPSVILDKLLERDLRWLSEGTVPLGGVDEIKSRKT